PPGGGVKHLRIIRSEPAFGGRRFGKVGAYEQLFGEATMVVDPKDPRNTGIVDLDKVKLNQEGYVEYATGFSVLRPKDPSKGNGTLLYEIDNRGRRDAMWMFNHGILPTEDGGKMRFDTRKEAGDGFLMEQGYTLGFAAVFGDVKGKGIQRL